MNIAAYKIKKIFSPKKATKSSIYQMYSIPNLKDIVNENGRTTDSERLKKDWVAVGGYIAKSMDNIKLEIDHKNGRTNNRSGRTDNRYCAK